MGTTFVITTLAWIFFRASSIGAALSYIEGLFSRTLFSLPNIKDGRNMLPIALLLVFFILVEWLGRMDLYPLERITSFFKKRFVRWSFYMFLIFLIFMFMETEETPFIYFQF